jgi:dTDP-4-dehydrorhamnose 3,5-epimerase
VRFSFDRIEGVPGLILLEPEVYEDGRGVFMEMYNRSDLRRAGINDDFIQDNYSRSSRGTVRGLHWQAAPIAQSKLISCVGGEIFDVALDIRKGSPSFGRYKEVILSEDNRKMFYIPKGFAHGFAVLSDEAEVIYKVDNYYSPEHERGCIWNDPGLGIEWPVEDPILSDKDLRLPLLKDADTGFDYDG